MAKARQSSPALETKGSVLRPEVAAKYAVPKGRTTVFVSAEFGRVDLSAVSLQMAHRLAAKGFLEKIPNREDA